MGGIIGIGIIALLIILIVILAVALSKRKGKSPEDSGAFQLLQQNNAEQIDLLRKTMQEQIESMRQEYGDRFADMPSEALVEELQGRVDNARKFTIREIDAANRDRLEKLTEITEELKKDLVALVRKEIGPIATVDKIQFAQGLPKTRSGKIMRRILRKIAENDYSDLGDTSTLAEPNVLDDLISNRVK